MRQLDLNIGERKLPNGLTLIAVQNPGVQTFAAGMVFDVDQRDERRGEEGLGNLLGDCLDEGSKKRSDAELADAADLLGASLSGNSSGGSVACPAKNAKKSLRLLDEMLTEPAFPGRGVARVQQEVLQEIAAEQADPRSVAHRRFRRLVYGKHPFGRPAHGSARQVAAYKPADLRRYHKRWFVAEDAAVAASGPMPVEETLDLLQGVFKGLKGKHPEHQRPAAPALPDDPVDEHIALPREQVHIFVGHVGVPRTHPDFYALSVMDHVLGSGPGFTSRISKRLRDDEGLCYTVHASIASSAGEEPGTFAAYIGTSKEHRQRAIDGFFEEIERMRKEPVSAQELEDVQKYLTGSYVFGFERNSQLARYALRARRFGLGYDYVAKYPDLIRSVTVEEVLRVAQEHLHPEKMVRVSAGA